MFGAPDTLHRCIITWYHRMISPRSCHADHFRGYQRKTPSARLSLTSPKSGNTTFSGMHTTSDYTQAADLITLREAYREMMNTAYTVHHLPMASPLLAPGPGGTGKIYLQSSVLTCQATREARRESNSHMILQYIECAINTEKNEYAYS